MSQSIEPTSVRQIHTQPCLRLRVLHALVLGVSMTTIVLAGAGTASAMSSSTPRPKPKKVTICHATGSTKNPYVTITVSVNSTDFMGHLTHDSDLIPAPASGCPKKRDVCPNIPGIQATVPQGKIIDSSGSCVEQPSPDVCPNIDGIQATVPTGKVKDSTGNCVSPQSPPPPSPPPPPAPPVSEPTGCTPWTMHYGNYKAGVDISCAGSNGGWVSILGDPVVYTNLPGSAGSPLRLQRTYEIGYGSHTVILADGTQFQWGTYAGSNTIKWLAVTKGGLTYTAIGLASGTTPNIKTTLTTSEMQEFETALFACASTLHQPISC